MKYTCLSLSLVCLIACGDDDVAEDSGPAADVSSMDTSTTPDVPDSNDAGGEPDAGEDDDSGVVDSSTPDAAVDLFPDGLSCPTISLCSTYSADPTRVPNLEMSGGELPDGLYQAVQGTNIPFGFAVSGDKYALIFENLSGSFGTIELEGGQMRLIQERACANGVDTELEGVTTTSMYFVDGDELFTFSGCDSMDPDNCNSPTRYVRVNDLCENLDMLSCAGGDCNCVTFRDVIPERNDTCEF